MANSTHLRQIHTQWGGGRHIFGDNAKQFEKRLANCIPEVLNLLHSTYPDYTFTHQKRINKREFHSQCNWLGDYYESENPFFSPDGGVILVSGGKLTRSHIVYIGEAKKQGTNDVRALEGLKAQAQGNAIERSFKNFAEARIIMHEETYFPYAVFCYGIDFAPGSSILDRLTAATWNYPFNHIYCEKMSGNRERVSVFCNVSGFTLKEMRDISFNLSQRSMECILQTNS